MSFIRPFIHQLLNTFYLPDFELAIEKFLSEPRFQKK